MHKRRCSDRTAVKLFWEWRGHVVGPQTRFDVNEWNLAIESSERCCEHRCRITLGNDAIGFQLLEMRVELGDERGKNNGQILVLGLMRDCEVRFEAEIRQ